MVNVRMVDTRRFGAAALAGVMALALATPSAAFADYYFGDGGEGTPVYKADEDASGEGWSYAADGQQMNLVDYVGESIYAYEQDLVLKLEGDNVVEGGIDVDWGDLSIVGDGDLHGDEKPSLTIVEGDSAGSRSYVGATAESSYDEKADQLVYSDGGNVTVKDAILTFDTASGELVAQGGNLVVENSKIARGEGNESLSIAAYGYNDNADIVLKGSEVEATSVSAPSGTLTVDNTNLTVSEGPRNSEAFGDTWIEGAVAAAKGIVLKGEANGEVVKVERDGWVWYYLSTGGDDLVMLRASATPAYWGATKGMPAASDAVAPLAAVIRAFVAASAAFAMLLARKRAGE